MTMVAIQLGIDDKNSAIVMLRLIIFSDKYKICE
jgi:hypothetical protein